MFERVLGHFTILFWGFVTKMNENDEKKEGIENNGIKMGQGLISAMQNCWGVYILNIMGSDVDIMGHISA